MVVTVADVVRAADAAGELTVATSGDVAADRRTLDGDNSEAHLTLRVPTTDFSSTMDKLAHLGTEQSRAVTTQDVTDLIVDLDARLATQRASVNRVRALFARATTITDIVTIESELTKREADLDSLEQRQATLSGQVALSTITLTLRAKATSPAAAPSHGGLLYGLRSGWSAFLVAAKALLTVAGWLAPWLVIVGVPAGSSSTTYGVGGGRWSGRPRPGPAVRTRRSRQTAPEARRAPTRIPHVPGRRTSGTGASIGSMTAADAAGGTARDLARWPDDGAVRTAPVLRRRGRRQ